jgi:hypothetical protein
MNIQSIQSFNLRKLKPLIFSAVMALMPWCTAQAQLTPFVPFQAAAFPVEIQTMQTNGNASLYDLTLWINLAGGGAAALVAGVGSRYDLAADAFNTTRTAASVVQGSGSRLGGPVISKTNVTIENYGQGNVTNTVTTTNAAISLLLNDGTRFKGRITREVNVARYFDGQSNVVQTNYQSLTISGGATRLGGFGYGSGFLNLSN